MLLGDDMTLERAKFHVIKLANEAVNQVRREEARNNFQIKGRR